MLIKKHLSLNFYIIILLNFSLFAQTNIDFETDNSGLNWNWTVADNGNNTPLEFVSNPNITELNSSGTTAKFISSPDGQPWALTYTDDFGSITFSEENSLIKMMVLKTISTPVAIKFEDSMDPSFYKQVEVSNNITNGEWEEMIFDFSTVIGNTYDRMVIIPDFLERSDSNVIYFDQITFNGGGAVENYNQQDIDFEVDGFGSNWVWTVHNNFSNPNLEIVSNPNSSGLNATDQVAKFTSLSEGQPWALTFTDNIGTFMFNQNNKIISVMVLKTFSSNFGIKFEYVDPTNQQVVYFKELVLTNNITNGEWEQLVFDFSSEIGIAYNRLVIIPDFAERSQTNFTYFDQLSFGSDSTAAIGPIKSDNLILFPNPAIDKFKISLLDDQNIDIYIYDTLGKCVKRILNSDSLISDLDLKSGLYFVHVKNLNISVIKRLMIQ